MVETQELNKTTVELNLKMATVTDLTDTFTALVTFYGETEASQKAYSYLQGYSPAIDDIVLMVPFSDTYIILGKISSGTDTPTSFVTQEQLSSAISNFITNAVLTQTLADYVTRVYADSAYAAKSHTHSNYTTETKIKEYTGWNDSQDTINNASGYYNSFKLLYAYSGFKHNGDLGFFGSVPATKLIKPNFDTTTTNLSTIIGYINQILDLLRRYGLT